MVLPAWRELAYLGAVIGVLFAGSATAQERTYRVKFEAQAPRPNPPSVVLYCIENKVCRGEIELQLGRNPSVVTAVALFTSGLAVVGFHTEKIPLVTGDRLYRSFTLVGPSQHVQATLAVGVPNPQTLADLSRHSNVTNPIWRPPLASANVNLDIQSAK